jgi:L-alanine-DL-glutamate epimerase-like enolase superfamily enzyme
MKITGVTTTLYSIKQTTVWADANSPSGRTQGASCLVELATDAGLTGVAIGGGGVRPQIQSLVEGILIGQDPRHLQGLWKRMVDKHFKGGHDGLINDAISVLDVALWDLKAKTNDEPLWKTLGGTDPKTPAYASGLDLPLSDQQIFDWYAHMATQHGFTGGKLKVGLDQDADLRRLSLMHDALKKSTENPVLLIDANEYWSPKQAVRYITELEKDFDLTWVEEPARRWDYDGLRLVSNQVSAAVATGENLNSIADFYPLVANQAVDILNISSGHSGIAGCRQVANLAYAYELPVSMMNCPANFMAHLAAALPNHISMEVVDPGREHAMQYSQHIEDGFIHLSNQPRLGIEIDMDALAAVQAQPPNRHSKFPFARRQGAGRYIMPPQPGEVPWT